MSLHFEFVLRFDLRPDTPEQVINLFHAMVNNPETEIENVPDHDFFADADWRDYFKYVAVDKSLPGEVGCSFRLIHRYGTPYNQAPNTSRREIIERNSPLIRAGEYTIEHYRYSFSLRCCWLDDIFYNWWLFATWIAPYSETQGFVGYYRENYDLNPTIIYFIDDLVYINDVKSAPLDIVHGKPYKLKRFDLFFQRIAKSAFGNYMLELRHELRN